MQARRTSGSIAIVVAGLACAATGRAQVLQSIEIVGPDIVYEQSETAYQCIAHFDIGDEDVTAFADWAVEPDGVASIEGGVLVVGDLSQDAPLTLSASYEFFDVEKADDLGVLVKRHHWKEAAKLQPDELEPGDRCSAVAMPDDGSFLVVSAASDDDLGSGSGVFYAYDRDETGEFVLTQTVHADDGAGGDYFGITPDISGSTLITGAYQDDDLGGASGAAYIFDRNREGLWVQTQKLLASDGQPGDFFGYTTAIDGDYAAVDTPFMNAENVFAAGTVYVFERDDQGVWAEVAKLHAADPQPEAFLGWGALAISGNTLVAGAWGEDIDGFENAGAAYVFERTDQGQWLQSARLTSPDGPAEENFAGRVAISGDTIALNAGEDLPGEPGVGSVYIFERIDGEWTPTAKLLASHADASDNFGASIDLRGDEMAVGASMDEGANGLFTGTAYYFQRDEAGDWIELDRLYASDGTSGDSFARVQVADGVLAVGASKHDGARGAVWVFEPIACAADHNADGDLDILDFVAFQIDWLAQDPAADCDASGTFDVLDFVCFQGLFQGGCP